MKNLHFILAILTAGVLSACASDDVPSKPNRAEVQATCSRHYAYISDEFVRGSKIKGCMRERGAL
ncbi:hypothetical protein [Alysiella crassa]|uniref:Entry exclusion lipoprotein TrbK n=1 Tax=Alysiella crassa TaxID=153491 RepID=A0A376BLK1_9NEIS|nr:hypothetical protein [Alysiella crassa]UOP07240.1 hypothetical protein LVJ80_01970 [Alysiella crassa]SSY70589.1 Uncharacterised protein [Alysiella crassa]